MIVRHTYKHVNWLENKLADHKYEKKEVINTMGIDRNLACLETQWEEGNGCSRTLNGICHCLAPFFPTRFWGENLFEDEATPCSFHIGKVEFIVAFKHILSFQPFFNNFFIIAIIILLYYTATATREK